MVFPAAAVIAQQAAIIKDFNMSTSGRNRGFAQNSYRQIIYTLA
jgi:hypothetical protein